MLLIYPETKKSTSNKPLFTKSLITRKKKASHPFSRSFFIKIQLIKKMNKETGRMINLVRMISQPVICLQHLQAHSYRGTLPTLRRTKINQRKETVHE